MEPKMGAAELAWALADRVDERLRAPDRHSIYVPLGSGDTDKAIVGLIAAAVRERVRLPRRLIDALKNWNLVHHHVDTELGRAIASIPIAREPRRMRAPKKAQYLKIRRTYRRI